MGSSRTWREVFKRPDRTHTRRVYARTCDVRVMGKISERTALLVSDGTHKRVTCGNA